MSNINSIHACPPDNNNERISPATPMIIERFVRIICQRDSATSSIVCVLLCAQPMIPCFATKTSSLKCPFVKINNLVLADATCNELFDSTHTEGLQDEDNRTNRGNSSVLEIKLNLCK